MRDFWNIQENSYIFQIKTFCNGGKDSSRNMHPDLKILENKQASRKTGVTDIVRLTYDTIA